MGFAFKQRLGTSEVFQVSVDKVINDGTRVGHEGAGHMHCFCLPLFSFTKIVGFLKLSYKTQLSASTKQTHYIQNEVSYL